MSEPIPAPDEDTASPGSALFELDELDSLDRELAGMDGGEPVGAFHPDEGAIGGMSPMAETGSGAAQVLLPTASSLFPV